LPSVLPIRPAGFGWNAHVPQDKLRRTDQLRQKPIYLGTAAHLALDEFEFGDLTFLLFV
jgi:hypothetical protein